MYAICCKNCLTHQLDIIILDDTCHLVFTLFVSVENRQKVPLYVCIIVLFFKNGRILTTLVYFDFLKVSTYKHTKKYYHNKTTKKN